MKNKTILIHAALLSVAFIYGANYSIAKYIMPDYIQAFAIILMRVLGATILFWIVAPKEKLQSKRDYLYLALCSLFGVAINQLFFFKGLSYTVPINASVIMTTTPIMVLISTAIILKEKITSTKILGIIFGFTGAVLLITNGGFNFNTTTFKGDIMILINALSYGTYLVLAKPIMNKYHPLTIVKWIFTFGCIYVFPFGFFEFQQIDWSIIPTNGFIALGYIIVFTTFFAYLLNAWALKHASPNLVGYYIYLQPIIATIIAIIFRGDALTISVVLFSSLIFVGVYLVGKK